MTDFGVAGLSKADPDNDLVFPLGRGTPPRHGHVRERFVRVLDQAGVQSHTMHDLRDTCSTTLLRSRGFIREWRRNSLVTAGWT